MKKNFFALIMLVVVSINCMGICASAATHSLDFGQVGGETHYFVKGQRGMVTITQNTPLDYTKNTTIDIAVRGVWTLFDLNHNTKLGFSINDSTGKCHVWKTPTLNANKSKTYNFSVTDTGYYTFAIRNMTARKCDNSFTASIPQYTISVKVD